MVGDIPCDVQVKNIFADIAAGEAERLEKEAKVQAFYEGPHWAPTINRINHAAGNAGVPGAGAAAGPHKAALQAATSQAFPAPATGPALGDQVAAFADRWASRKMDGR